MYVHVHTYVHVRMLGEFAIVHVWHVHLSTTHVSTHVSYVYHVSVVHGTHAGIHECVYMCTYVRMYVRMCVLACQVCLCVQPPYT